VASGASKAASIRILGAALHFWMIMCLALCFGIQEQWQWELLQIDFDLTGEEFMGRLSPGSIIRCGAMTDPVLLSTTIPIFVS
jgi:hypothetical protein